MLTALIIVLAVWFVGVCICQFSLVTGDYRNELFVKKECEKLGANYISMSSLDWVFVFLCNLILSFMWPIYLALLGANLIDDYFGQKVT